MSQGGVFQLLTNQGRQDNLLLAIRLLKERVRQIKEKNMKAIRRENPSITSAEMKQLRSQWIPTLKSIETTHSVFIKHSFKPFLAMTHEYSKNVTGRGTQKLGSTYNFNINQKGQFTNDMVMYVKLTGLQATSSLDKVRYAEFLGHRLMKNVKFKIQQQVFDEYDSDVQNAEFHFNEPFGKEKGYLRNIGQETPEMGYLTADPTSDEVREYRWFGQGPQTFKRTQLDVEMWIPLQFWFRDIRMALPNFMLPTDQVQVEVEFEQEANLVAYANYGGGGTYSVPTVAESYLYVNHLFIQPEIETIFRERFKFQLIRVWKVHREKGLRSSSGDFRLKDLKYPVETLYVGFRPQVNLTNSQQWHRMSNITTNTYKSCVVTGVSTIQVNSASYLTNSHVVSKLALKSHDITIYPETSPQFYADYLPHRYGDFTKTPNESGWMMFNFNEKPNSYEPSGHFNTSRSRELYLHYTTASNSGVDVIRDANPVDVIIIARCINFLTFDSGAVALRYAT